VSGVVDGAGDRDWALYRLKTRRASTRISAYRQYRIVLVEVLVPDRAVSRSRRAVIAAGLALAGAHLLPGLPLGTEAFRDRDCSDFRTQKKAQRWFKRHGGSRSYDPWNLDSDNDGKACEDLP